MYSLGNNGPAPFKKWNTLMVVQLEVLGAYECRVHAKLIRLEQLQW